MGNKKLVGIQNVVVEGMDWGPSVTKTILKFDEVVTRDCVSADKFKVVETKESFNWKALAEGKMENAAKHITIETQRKVLKAYTCNENGEKSLDSEYIALELNYGPEEGTPFCYDLFVGNNTICSPYDLTVSLNKKSTLKDAKGNEVDLIQVNKTINFDDAIYPQLQNVDTTLSFSGVQGHEFKYASFEPYSDGQKHPLVIWLHGAGEGGHDPRLNTLGNKVTALYGEEFQTVMKGAYILAPQCPTFWMEFNEKGSWMDNPGVDSIYLADLKQLIDIYVEAHKDIDRDRILVGGCSNGGYMTMDLIMNYPDYFAAAYPICEAYADEGIKDEQIKAIKNIPIWFIYAENDTTVPPAKYEEPTISRLQKVSKNIHTSIFKDVHDTTGLYKDKDGNAYQYMGHWSWLYFFNNECKENGINMWKWLAEQHR